MRVTTPCVLLLTTCTGLYLVSSAILSCPPPQNLIPHILTVLNSLVSQATPPWITSSIHAPCAILKAICAVVSWTVDSLVHGDYAMAFKSYHTTSKTVRTFVVHACVDLCMHTSTSTGLVRSENEARILYTIEKRLYFAV